MYILILLYNRALPFSRVFCTVQTHPRHLSVLFVLLLGFGHRHPHPPAAPSVVTASSSGTTFEASMPSSPSLATFLAETDASKDASHSKTVSSQFEVSMEIPVSTGKINEVSSPKPDTVTGSAPSVVNAESVCGFALEEVQVEEVGEEKAEQMLHKSSYNL